MKSKPLIILAVTFFVVAALAFFLILPVASSILASWRSLGEARQNLATIDEKKAVLEKLQNTPELQSITDIAKKYIPEDQQAGELVLEITSMAVANNLKVEQTSLAKSQTTTKTDETPTPSPKSKTGPSPSTSPKIEEQTKTVDFTMQISGSFGDFMNFLKSIETGSRLITVKNISLQTKSGADKITFSVQMSGGAYYKSKVTLEDTLENIKISPETIEDFLNLKAYSQPINLPSESGFGRTNPFENY